MTALDFVAERLPELMLRTREHLILAGVSTGFAVAAGVPLGIYIAKKRWLRSFVFSLAGTVQTVPSLAMLAFLLALTGKIGFVPAIIALALYALLPIVRNTVTALDGVSADMLEASAGMGMTPWQETRMVKLPLAMPVIMAGVNTAAVISVGIATLSAFIGAGGLGEFINRGLALSDTRLILLGAFPSALLALYVSFAITSAEWGLNEKKRRRSRLLAGAAGRAAAFAPLLLLFALAVFGSGKQAGPADAAIIRIGSKNFTEQLILAEMMAQRIEESTGLRVERVFNLGGTMICHEALVEGEIDLYAEYTGTALTAILKSETRPPDPGGVYALVRGRYRELFGLSWLGPFGFNNTYALAVRRGDAERHGWKTVSDLKRQAPSLRAGFTSEFSGRPDGYPGFREAYGFGFGAVSDLDPALMYDAVKAGQVDVISAFSTDSRIPGYGLAVLEDDRAFFPPYYSAPVVRGEVLESHPEIKEALSSLEGILDEETMQALNYEVDRKRRKVDKVVDRFLRKKGLKNRPE
jgi:osmoprotectant transport system permease protein